MTEPSDPNSAERINARVDRLLGLIKVDHPTKELIDRVYRPFCLEMARFNREQKYPVITVVEGCISLIANMVSELARSTSDNPAKWAVGIMKAVKQYNKQQDWKTPETDALIKKRMN
jgi:hypothetical protein